MNWCRRRVTGCRRQFWSHRPMSPGRIRRTLSPTPLRPYWSLGAWFSFNALFTIRFVEVETPFPAFPPPPLIIRYIYTETFCLPFLRRFVVCGRHRHFQPDYFSSFPFDTRLATASAFCSKVSVLPPRYFTLSLLKGITEQTIFSSLPCSFRFFLHCNRHFNRHCILPACVFCLSVDPSSNRHTIEQSLL